MESFNNIPHFDVYIADINTHEIQELLKNIRPNWNFSVMKFKTFTGTSNRLIGCFIDGDIDMVVIRLYGKDSECFVNHQQEIKYMNLLHQHDLASKVLCTFGNGYCHEYVLGETLTVLDLQKKVMAERCAKLIAKLHSVPLEEEHKTTQLFETIRKYLKLTPAKFENKELNNRYEKHPTLHVLSAEVDQLEKVVQSHKNQEIVLCHNDISSANLIYNEKQDTLHFIDYEFSFPDYPAFEVGNLFDEFGGVEGNDYSLYPDENFQKWWIRIYLEERNRLKGSNMMISEDNIHTFYIETNHFALVSHLFWISWAILQAHMSELDNDYLGYAINRITEYYRRKDTFIQKQK